MLFFVLFSLERQREFFQKALKRDVFFYLVLNGSLSFLKASSYLLYVDMTIGDMCDMWSGVLQD